MKSLGNHLDEDTLQNLMHAEHFSKNLTDLNMRIEGTMSLDWTTTNPSGVVAPDLDPHNKNLILRLKFSFVVFIPPMRLCAFQTTDKPNDCA